jgi:DTW domain-containing protein YfiP
MILHYLSSEKFLPHVNAVQCLRKRELAFSTREFKARGYKVKRCEDCLLPLKNCICSDKPTVTNNSAFCLIMYKSEYYKPSNTGRIIANVIQDNYAFRWDRVSPEADLLELLANPKYAPILVFPHQYAEQDRCIHKPLDLKTVQQGIKPLFVILDGTWREAKKMFKSPTLAHLPLLSIEPQQASSYQLREAAHSHQLCSAEVAIEVLKLADDNQAAQVLEAHFRRFKQAYIAGKPHMTLI